MEKEKTSHQIIAIVVSCLSAFTTGIMFSWTSPFLVKITKDKLNYNITEDQASYFAVIPPASMVVAAIFCTRLSDIIGRKYTIMLTALPYTTFWILTAFFTNIYVLYAARMIAGFGDAIVFTSVPMYIDSSIPTATSTATKNRETPRIHQVK
ncbi:unnamed protein product [Acanthoscelides obtectus]|uniref:Major facilitator superfamily (MFS) profile domain-containing protein n=1 Tax=Acanthoscelides obtectus TaxID=200917 RepID=A0A9P0PSM1_ACAOB|nr:unnamed protein product [Acanthoscelides obtectus]CAK1656556.1 Facilitated trehalose transporter Tret1 [Acanthoscelides obtectus]